MQGYWKWEVKNASLFRYLNPPMISEVYKTTCVLNFYIIYCCRRLLSWYRQLPMFNRYHDDRPKTYFTNITSQITMPWNRTCCSYQLEIFKQYAQIYFEKSENFRILAQAVWEIFKKTRGADKNNPPATNKVKPLFAFAPIRNILFSDAC